MDAQMTFLHFLVETTLTKYLSDLTDTQASHFASHGHFCLPHCQG